MRVPTTRFAVDVSVGAVDVVTGSGSAPPVASPPGNTVMDSASPVTTANRDRVDSVTAWHRERLPTNRYHPPAAPLRHE